MKEQLEILKEFTEEIEQSGMKYKNHVSDRLSYDGYHRYILCIEEFEKLFSNTSDEENVKSWIIENLGE